MKYVLIALFAACPLMAGQSNVLRTTGNADTVLAPDYYEINAMIEVRGAEAARTMDSAVGISDKVLAALTKLDTAIGIDVDAIRNEYSYAERSFSGYERNEEPFTSTIRIQVRSRNIKLSHDVFTALVGTGCTDVNTPVFRIDDRSPVVALLMKKAVERAEQEARKLAAAVGAKKIARIGVQDGDKLVMMTSVQREEALTASSRGHSLMLDRIGNIELKDYAGPTEALAESRMVKISRVVDVYYEFTY